MIGSQRQDLKIPLLRLAKNGTKWRRSIQTHNHPFDKVRQTLQKFALAVSREVRTALQSSFRATACLALSCAVVQSASANLVQNGDFTSVSYSGGKPLTTLFGQFGTGTGSTLTVANWATAGYNFVYAPNTVDTGTSASGANAGKPNEAPGQYNAPNGYGNTYMWGSNNGGASVIPATSPAGGNFIAADGAFEIGALTQSVTGLTVGRTYALKFWWAGAQQENFTGITTENWTVAMGTGNVAGNFVTPTVTVPNHGFSGWMQQTFYFYANNSTETLSFLAAGTPNGEPPFSLLGGVDLEVVPEFSSWMAFAGFGVACIVFECVRRRRQQLLFASAA